MDYEESHFRRKPDRLKLITLNDMKRLGFNITKELLRKYGFTDFEINWIIDNDTKQN